MKSDMEQPSSLENQKAIVQQQHPIITNPSLFKFPGDDQLLNRIGQVERFSEEERHQFGMCCRLNLLLVIFNVLTPGSNNNSF